MASFDGLGKALRWVRLRQGRKQFELAAAARITKAMLSSYENDKQRPTLDTLERLLDALGIDLDYLAYAMRVVRHERALQDRQPSEPPRPPGEASPRVYDPLSPTGLDLERLLGLAERLDPAEERSVSQMLAGFHSLVRYMVRKTAATRRQRDEESASKGGDETPAPRRPPTDDETP